LAGDRVGEVVVGDGGAGDGQEARGGAVEDAPPPADHVVVELAPLSSSS
jgi:hypothetical protein